MANNKRPFLYASIFSVALVGALTFCLCDTFLIPKVYGHIDDSSSSENNSSSENSSEEISSSTSSEDPNWPDVPVLTSNSYKSNKVRINIETVKIPSTTTSGKTTTTYIGDIELKSLDNLATTFAVDSYGNFGKNIVQKTSEILSDHNGILGINGDYCWYRDYGIVVRGGKVYRNSARTESKVEDLVIYNDGTFATVNEKTSDAYTLVSNGARDVFSFGPGLVKNSEVAVTVDEEVLSQSKTSNPRTAIGFISPLHYVFVVSDGRTSISTGLSLYELANVLKSKGVVEGFNLDGGGSSTMVFDGTVVNKPTNDGRTIVERSISDIIYVKD